MKLKKLIDKAYALPNSSEVIMKIHEVLNEHMCELSIINPKMYDKAMDDVYIAIYGPHFNEESATEAVAQFINSDGTMGQHWSFTDTTNAARSAGVVFDKFNEWDWFFTMNLMYSDYYKLFTTSDNTYISLARSFLEEKNAPVGKAFYYWEMIEEDD